MNKSLTALKTLSTEINGEIRAITNSREKAVSDIHSKAKEIDVLTKVNSFFTKTIESKVVDTKIQIEDIINTGLNFIFGEDIKIRLDTVERRNRTEFVLNICSGEIEGLRETHGGGVLAVISFLFKVVIAVLFKHRRFLTYDETLTFVSKEYQERVSEFIHKLCIDLDFTIMLISHQPLLSTYADRVYTASKNEQSRTKFKTTESQKDGI